MPYISDAERERARWMTLTELSAHVTKHHRGRPADQQIHNALSDGKLITKWEDATAHQYRPRLPTDPPSMISVDGLSESGTVPDWLPHKGDFWQKARIRRGKVFDPYTQQWRVLLILKDSIFAHPPGRRSGPQTPPAVATLAVEPSRCRQDGARFRCGDERVRSTRRRNTETRLIVSRKDRQ